MQLLLSSAALPDASLENLEDAAQRRSLRGLELVLEAGHAHGLDAARELRPVGHEVDDRTATPSPVRWVLAPSRAGTGEVLYWGHRAHILRAGLIVKQPVAEVPPGVRTALLHTTDVEEASRAAVWAERNGAYTCWEVNVGRLEADVLYDVLEVTGPHLVHVRLLGAGPESQQEEADVSGRGALFSQLALQGYGGSIALAPSAPERTALWHAWLLEQRGWGCGTAARKKAARAP